MKNQFTQAVKNTTEARALLVLAVLLTIRAWRTIPKLRPMHLALPATLALITTIVIAAYTPLKFLLIFSTGLFIVLAVFMFPMLRQPAKQTAHWVGSNE